MSHGLQCNPADAIRFLTWLGRNDLYTIPFDGGECTHHSPDDVAAWLPTITNQNVYYAVNEPGPNGARTKTSMRSATCLEVDLDLDGAHRQSDILIALERFQLPPSAVILSGGGVNALWRLREPLALPGHSEAVEAANRWLLAQFSKIAKVDGTHDVTRVLRLPGSINILNPKKVAAGRKPALAELIILEPERLYTLDQFGISANATKAARCVDDITNEATQTELTELMERYSVPRHVLHLIRTGAPVSPETFQAYAETRTTYTAEDKAKDSARSRNEWVFAVTRYLIQAGVPDDKILGVLLDHDYKISEHIYDKHKPYGSPLKYAQRQVRRVLERCEDGDPRKKPQQEQRAKPSRSILEEMNEEHAVLTREAGKCRVLCWGYSAIDPNRKVPLLQTCKDFELAYSNKFIQSVNAKGDTTSIPVGKWWLSHPQRRQYHGLRFEPLGPEVIEGYLNLWTGWAVEPKAGDWSLLKAHIHNVLASGNEEHAAYILKWAAWAVQNPGEPAGVALVFQGAQGAGKGLFCRAVMQLFGQHGSHISNPDHLSGNFNGHLRDCCLLFADEAIAPSDKKAEKAIYRLITEPTLSIERKGLDVVTDRNYLHVVMATNEDWAAPVAKDDRRFAVFQVSGEHARDKEYFTPIYEQLENGGLAAMLHELQTMDLNGWAPRDGIPETRARSHQMTRSLRGAELRFFKMLESGNEFGCIDSDGPKVFIATRLAVEEMKMDSREETALATEIKLVCNKSERRYSKQHRAYYRGYWMPSLSEARRKWCAAKGQPEDIWDEPELEWTNAGDDYGSDPRPLVEQRLREN